MDEMPMSTSRFVHMKFTESNSAVNFPLKAGI
jgi:hypothetical protein